MASSTEVVVSLGFDSGRIPKELREYLTTPHDLIAGQHLAEVCSSEKYPEPYGLPGSGQAGAVLIYAGLIRRSGSGAIKEWLLEAPWKHEAPIVIIYDESFGPEIFSLK